jgi:hypothetical protein
MKWFYSNGTEVNWYRKSIVELKIFSNVTITRKPLTSIVDISLVNKKHFKMLQKLVEKYFLGKSWDRIMFSMTLYKSRLIRNVFELLYFMIDLPFALQKVTQQFYENLLAFVIIFTVSTIERFELEE